MDTSRPARVHTPESVKKGWIMYDWANSAYFLVITAAIFPVYYNAVTTTDSEGTGPIDIVQFFGLEFVNTQLYSYVIAASFLVVITASPLLSGMADYLGRKLMFLKVFSYVGITGCIALLWFNVEHLEWSLLALFLANIGAWGGLGFYNAYLPEIAPPEEHDQLSAKGYSWGYVSAVLLMVICLAVIFTVGAHMTPWAFVAVGVWWLFWSQYAFRRLPSNVKDRPEGSILLMGFRELRGVARAMKGKPRIVRYLLSFFTMSMAIQTIVFMASSFGVKEVKLDEVELIIAILLVQIIAIPGAFLFSWLSGRFGNIKTLIVATALWGATCVFAYSLVNGSTMFFAAAGLIGFMMGGTQSVNRSTYTKMLPDTEDTASYFSFYEVLEKLGVVIGMFSFGYIEGLTGSMRNSVLALIGFFAVALILLMSIPKERASVG